MITIYYGMCGSLKFTTMNQLFPSDCQILSDIKPFVDYSNNLFQGKSLYNDLTLAVYRLQQIKNFKTVNKSISIERGITDFLQCYIMRGNDLPESLIKNVVQEESKLLLDKNLGSLKKILLVMEDTDFILNKVLNEPHRRNTYPNIEIYLKEQENYVQFTKQYNQIDSIIHITDAMDYIKKLSVL